MIGGSLFVSLSLLLTAELERESQLETAYGMLERWANPKDEREFGVRLRLDNGESTWLEEAHASTDGARIVRSRSTGDDLRAPASSLDTPEQVLWVHPEFATRSLGISDRVFEKECSAITQVKSPSSREVFKVTALMTGLECNASHHPITATARFKVNGQGGKNWVHGLFLLPTFDLWNLSSPQVETQVSATYYLTSILNGLANLNLHTQQEPITVKAWSSEGNRSEYEADARVLSYGGGKYLDSLDGFVVIHEWTHSLLDDLNRGTYGYPSRILHEALADIMPALHYDSSCIGPYDAQEVAGRECLRNLAISKKLPDDVHGNDSHEDSLVVSSATWELRDRLSTTALLTSLLETWMRMPKNPDPKMFWAKWGQVLDRLQDLHAISAKAKEAFVNVGLDHGLMDPVSSAAPTPSGP